MASDKTERATGNGRMLCDNCGEREAEIHHTQIVDDEMTTVHYCDLCAAEKGIGVSLQGPKAPLADFLAQLGREREDPQTKEPCPYCGTTARDFRQSGRLGCAQCYVHFEPQLRGLLRRLHGSTQHMGKLYLNEGSELGDRGAQLAGMRRRLQRAIETEDFEAAAELRDRIHALETAE